MRTTASMNIIAQPKLLEGELLMVHTKGVSIENTETGLHGSFTDVGCVCVYLSACFSDKMYNNRLPVGWMATSKATVISSGQ